MFLHLMFSLQKVLKRHLVEYCRSFSIFSRLSSVILYKNLIFQALRYFFVVIKFYEIFTIFVFKFKNTKSFQNIKVNSLSSDELKIC